MPPPTVDFALPKSLERGAPPARRDDVRLMVGSRSAQGIVDAQFRDLPRFLRPGDVLVINTSATLPAAVDARTQYGEAVLVHFSSALADGTWTVEIRRPDGLGSIPYPDFGGGPLVLHGGGRLNTLARHRRATRLWVARIDVDRDLHAYLHQYGTPIRYGYTEARWPLDAYQTVFARVPGSAEMPSAGRPFTPEMITQLVASGIAVLPLLMHAGVASFEEGEYPPEEYYSVPGPTTAAVNALRNNGGRVIAVGTTVVRALETVVDATGQLRPGTGYTNHVITAETPLRAIDGLLTGWHEPHASHLELVEATAGHELIVAMYQRAVDAGYAWHEFGDSCLILP